MDAPRRGRTGVLSTDMVNMDAGRFSTDADGKYDINWGTCTLEQFVRSQPCRYGRESVAVGWQNETRRWDIGNDADGL